MRIVLFPPIQLGKQAKTEFCPQKSAGANDNGA